MGHLRFMAGRRVLVLDLDQIGTIVEPIRHGLSAAAPVTYKVRLDRPPTDDDGGDSVIHRTASFLSPWQPTQLGKPPRLQLVYDRDSITNIPCDVEP